MTIDASALPRPGSVGAVVLEELRALDVERPRSSALAWRTVTASLDADVVPIERRVRATLGIDDEDLARLIDLGLSHLAAKQPRSARSPFLLATRLEPECFVGHLYLGVAALELARPSEAAEHLAAAGALLEARPDRSANEATLLGEIALLYAAALVASGAIADAELALLRLAGAGLDASARATELLAVMRRTR
ncbi:hypothetical protein L6R52_43295 [Myxococcota bacterium]|nr:hypothetical protein [Myxococcota bacterium]